MILYANGCSMTYGSELADDPETKKCIDHEYREKTSWPRQLSNLLGTENFNHARPSASNEKILRTSMQWISEYLVEGRDPSELFVIIGWTNIHRREISYDKRWRSILPSSKSLIPEVREISRFFNEKIINVYQDTITFVNQIVLFQSFLENNQIPYLFFNSLPVDVEEKKSKTYLSPQLQIINRERYFRLTDYCFQTFVNENSYPLAKGHHPLEEGHREWAKRLHNYIVDKKLKTY